MGIDASRAMLAEYRLRAPAGQLGAVLGDFAELPFRRAFKLIFALCSTLHLLPSIERQARCLRSIAQALRTDGVFVSETFVGPDALAPVTAEYPIETPSGTRLYRVTTLSTPASLLDQMAADAGLVCVARHSDWHGSPADDQSPRRISLYRLSGNALPEADLG